MRSCRVMLAKCFLVGFLSITSPVSRKPRMWSPTYTGTALSESPANQVTVRFVESGCRDASVWAVKHAARALLKRARIDANKSRCFVWLLAAFFVTGTFIQTPLVSWFAMRSLAAIVSRGHDH